MSAPTGPEPEERVGMCGNLAAVNLGASTPALICDLPAGHAGWHGATQPVDLGASFVAPYRTSWTGDMFATSPDTSPQVSALQADVARLEGERDEARDQLAEAEVVLRSGATAYATYAMRRAAEVDPMGRVTGMMRDAMRKLVADYLAATEHFQAALLARPILVAWTPPPSAQDAPSAGWVPTQSDAEGSGVAQDVQEALGAQKGAQGASEAAYEAGVTEGRRQAVAAIRARVGAIAATEWAALIVEEEGRG